MTRPRLPKIPVAKPAPACPGVLSVNGVMVSVSVLPARLADGSAGNGQAGPSRLVS